MAWRDNDTGTNRRNPNRGDGDSPGERQGRGNAGFCPIPICWEAGRFPRASSVVVRAMWKGGFADVHHL